MADAENRQIARRRPATEQAGDAKAKRDYYELWKAVAQMRQELDQLSTDVSQIKRQAANKGMEGWVGEHLVESPAAALDVSEWTQNVRIHIRHVPSLPTAKRVVPPPGTGFGDRLSRVRDLLKQLQTDYANLQHRIVLANDLEGALGVLEQQLEDSDCRFLQWTVSLLKDVFSYNYAEDLTEAQLRAVSAALDSCEQKGFAFSKDDYERVYRNLLDLWLCLLPNSEKAIAKCCDE